MTYQSRPPKAIDGLIPGRLAAKYHQRQVALQRAIRQMVTRIGIWYKRLPDRLAQFAASAGLARFNILRAILDYEFAEIRHAIAGELELCAYRGYRLAVDAILAALPKSWLPFLLGLAGHQRKGLAEALPVSEPPPWGLEYELEPVVQGAMSRDEAMQWVRSRLFPAPSADDVQRWLTQAIPGGMSWDDRLRRWEQAVRAAMLNELVIGLSQGENVDGLRARLKPLAHGIAWKAQRIARTEGNRVAERANRQTIGGLGGLVQGMQIVAVMDEWTRPEHAARNGRIYFRGKDGIYRAETGEPLPDLPDAPNCRCTTVPVFRMPPEFRRDPALRAMFQTATGKLIPDPASYMDWWERANPKEQMMAVGAIRYQVVRDRLKKMSPPRKPQWPDFIDDQGRLLPIDRLKRETAEEWARRRRKVDAILQRRRAEFVMIAQKGYQPPMRNLSQELRLAFDPRKAAAWRQKIAQEVSQPIIDHQEARRRQKWAERLNSGRKVREEILKREEYHVRQRRRLEALAEEIRRSPLPAPDQQELLQEILKAIGEHRAAEKTAIIDCLEIPARRRGEFKGTIAPELKADEEEIRTGFTWIERIVDKKQLAQVKASIHCVAAPEDAPYKNRPYYLNNTMYLPVGRRRREDVVHEAAHHLERFLPKLREQMRQYYDEVTKGGTAQPLGLGYQQWETYVPRTDGRTWLRNYQGFTEGREFFTMKMQLLVTEPRRLMEEDPEVFDLLISRLRGL